MSISLKTLLLEFAENRGYAEGYQDGVANGRTQGREQGIAIAQRQIAKALLRKGLTLENVAQLTAVPAITAEESPPYTD